MYNPYAPQTLSELVLADSTRVKLTHILAGNLAVGTGLKHGILLYGEPGTGKSATAEILPELLDPYLRSLKQQFAPTSRAGNMFGQIYSTTGIHRYRVDCGFGENGGATLAAAITDFLGSSSRGQSGFAYIVLDEVDVAGKPFVDALKGMMETHKQVIWILTTNHLNKLPSALIDRCHLVAYHAADVAAWHVRCNQILAARNLPEITEQEVEQLCKDADGSARNIITYLDCAYIKLSAVV